MNTIIIGGSKSGKSALAEDLAVKRATNKRYYVATMIPFDDEDKKRIKRHIEERANKNFITLEIPNKIKEYRFDKDSTYLVDSLTAYLLNEILNYEQIDKEKIIDKIIDEFTYLLECNNVIIVADYIFSDSNEFSEYTQDYLEIYGTIIRKLITIIDNVIEVTAGNIKVHKGELI